MVISLILYLIIGLCILAYMHFKKDDVRYKYRVSGLWTTCLMCLSTVFLWLPVGLGVLIWILYISYKGENWM
jgi:hypothetical protein